MFFLYNLKLRLSTIITWMDDRSADTNIVILSSFPLDVIYVILAPNENNKKSRPATAVLSKHNKSIRRLAVARVNWMNRPSHEASLCMHAYTVHT